MRRKPLSILFALLAAAAVGARCYLYFTAIDPVTGFYVDSARALGLVVSVACAVGMIACVALFRLVSEPAAGMVDRAPEIGVVSFGMAAALGYEAVCGAMSEWADSPVRAVLTGVVALLAAVYFICAGVDRMRGTKNTPGLLYGAVPVWAAVKLVLYYTQFHGVVYISEGILEVFALALSMMFWLYHTRMVTGMNAGRAAQWGYGFGIAAAAACAMVTLPRLVARLMGRDDLTGHGSVLMGTLFISIVYIVVFLVRYHIASVDSPLLPEEEADPAAIPLAEGAASVEEMAEQAQSEQAYASPSLGGADDRIDRMVDELLREKQEGNDQ